MITLKLLTDGIKQVNQVYIENPEFDGNYPAMIVQYLISLFLIELGGKAEDFGLYIEPTSTGYTGWITISDETLFFAPTKIIILRGNEHSRLENDGELSPFGELP